VQDEPNKRARPAQRRVLRARILEQEVDRMKAGSRVLAAASSLSLGRCTRARWSPRTESADPPSARSATAHSALHART